jgi:hypothetical protein
MVTHVFMGRLDQNMPRDLAITILEEDVSDIHINQVGVGAPTLPPGPQRVEFSWPPPQPGSRPFTLSVNVDNGDFQGIINSVREMGGAYLLAAAVGPRSSSLV